MMTTDQRILDNDLRTLKAHSALLPTPMPLYRKLGIEESAKELARDRQRQAKHHAKQNWIRYVLCVPHVRRLQAFVEIYTHLSEREYWRLLGHVWRKRKIDIYGLEDLWTRLFTYPQGGREYFCKPKHRRIYDALPDEITIYRGYGEHNREGFYWSLNPHTALVFAAKAGQVGDYLKEKIKKSDCVYAGGILEAVIYIPEMSSQPL
jgi:hypothetical protein